MVMAHCSDEVDLGWPILQEREIYREVIVCSGSLEGKKALKELGNELEIKTTCLDYDGWLCELDKEDGTFVRMCKELQKKIIDAKYDYIFTHNMMGEDGNVDHQIVHNVAMNVKSRILMTDIFISGGWVPYAAISFNYKKTYFREKEARCEVNLDFYDKCRKIYFGHSAWQSEGDPVLTCNLYLV